MQYLPAKFTTETYQSTCAWIYCAAEGSGRTVVGDQILEWGPQDVFVVPGWMPHHHEADGEAFLFSFSDRRLQENLGLFRERRGNVTQ
jgi:gentisate 1,2-dioxygenase